MNLNLPIVEKLQNSENILIAGMGGGFDVFCGLPIFFELRERGMQVRLANYSFSAIRHIEGGLNHLSEDLAGVSTRYTFDGFYFPDYHLAKWFREELDEEITICASKRSVSCLWLRSINCLSNISALMPSCW